jgi:hypothetical protein
MRDLGGRHPTRVLRIVGPTDQHLSLEPYTHVLGLLAGDRRERVQQVTGGSREQAEPRRRSPSSLAPSWMLNLAF